MKQIVSFSIHEIFTLQWTLTKQYSCFKLVHFSKKVGCSSSASPGILAFVSHCSANFQLILDCVIPKFKLKYQDSENTTADSLNRVVFNLHQIKRRAFFWDTRYTSIPHELLKSRKAALTHNSFKMRDGSARYTHIKVGQRKGYSINSINGGGENVHIAYQICRRIDFLEGNIFVKFEVSLFRQIIGIPMRTNCSPLLADLFIYIQYI